MAFIQRVPPRCKHRLPHRKRLGNTQRASAPSIPPPAATSAVGTCAHRAQGSVPVCPSPLLPPTRVVSAQPQRRGSGATALHFQSSPVWCAWPVRTWTWHQDGVKQVVCRRCTIHGWLLPGRLGVVLLVAAALMCSVVCQPLLPAYRSLSTYTLISSERSALVDLYAATSGASWSHNTGWVDSSGGSDPCVNAWYGIVCWNGGQPTRVEYVKGVCRLCVLARMHVQQRRTTYRASVVAVVTAQVHPPVCQQAIWHDSRVIQSLG